MDKQEIIRKIKGTIYDYGEIMYDDEGCPGIFIYDMDIEHIAKDIYEQCIKNK